MLVFVASILACQAPSSSSPSGPPLADQRKISDIACGPSALYNWLLFGGDELQGVLDQVAKGSKPEDTVQWIIDKYGLRQSATNPSVTRYGRHNGGVGSVNLMLMATELLTDHLPSPPALRGEYLHKADSESPDEHLRRIETWFQRSLDSGIPVLLYVRGYQRTSGQRTPRTTFGHHVVVTELTSQTSEDAREIKFRFADSSTGQLVHGEMQIAEDEFTAPTFTYRFEGHRALTSQQTRTGRPLLEVRVPSYEQANSTENEVVVAHFATLADGPGIVE